MMDLSKEDIKTITNSLIKASNATETEWLNIEKITLESYGISSNEITASNVLRMWDQLHQKVEDAIKRMKKLEGK